MYYFSPRVFKYSDRHCIWLLLISFAMGHRLFKIIYVPKVPLNTSKQNKTTYSPPPMMTYNQRFVLSMRNIDLLYLIQIFAYNTSYQLHCCNHFRYYLINYLYYLYLTMIEYYFEIKIYKYLTTLILHDEKGKSKTYQNLVVMIVYIVYWHLLKNTLGSLLFGQSQKLNMIVTIYYLPFTRIYTVNGK